MSDLRDTVAAAGGTTPSVETRHHAAGEAALMLVEALMLGMIEARLFTAEAMAEMVESAIDAKRELVESGQHPEISRVAAGMLAAISNSLAAAPVGSGTRDDVPHASVITL